MTSHQAASWQTAALNITDLTVNGWQPPGGPNTGLLPAITAIYALPTRTTTSGGPPGKRAHPPAPWNVPAQHLISDIANAARTLEHQLCDAAGYSRPTRPMTDRQTHRALTRLALLAEHHQYVPCPPGCDLPEQVARHTTRWRNRCRLMLREDRHPARVPIPCPHCAAPHLWQQPSDTDPLGGLLYCANPDCLDPEGRRNTWQPDQWLGQLLA